MVPGHQGYSGNEKVDYVARKDTESPFIGPEYVCGIPKCVQEALQNARLEIHTLVNGPILQYKIMQKPLHSSSSKGYHGETDFLGEISDLASSTFKALAQNMDYSEIT